MFRLVTGMQRKPCPMKEDGGCYWCGAPLYYSDVVYIGDLVGNHEQQCPWTEVLAYASLRAYLEPPEGDDDPDEPATRPTD